MFHEYLTKNREQGCRMFLATKKHKQERPYSCVVCAFACPFPLGFGCGLYYTGLVQSMWWAGLTTEVPERLPFFCVSPCLWLISRQSENVNRVVAARRFDFRELCCQFRHFEVVSGHDGDVLLASYSVGDGAHGSVSAENRLNRKSTRLNSSHS